MNPATIDLNLNSSFHKPAKEMDDTELSLWFAFCNAIKFVNVGEELFKEEVTENDIPYKALYNYVQTVSGDMRSCLKANNGIPLKYSLCCGHEESKNITEIDYHVN